MLKVMQKYLHDPDNKVHGDCWRACIASITEIPIEEIPDPNDWEYDQWSSYWVSVWEFLQEKGFDLCNESIPNFKDKYGPVIASGKSPRGEFNHAVVWDKGIIHDPHPEGGGVHSILMFEVIEKIN